MDIVAFFGLMESERKKESRSCYMWHFFFAVGNVSLFHLSSSSFFVHILHIVYILNASSRDLVCKELKLQKSEFCLLLAGQMYSIYDKHKGNTITPEHSSCSTNELTAFCLSSQLIFQCGNLDSNLTFYCIIFSCDSLIMPIASCHEWVSYQVLACLIIKSHFSIQFYSRGSTSPSRSFIAFIFV